jgi:putative oxidoreductase
MNLDRLEKYTPEVLGIVRLMVGLLFLEHGTAKLLGFPPPSSGLPALMTLSWIQGLLELTGGTLMTVGLFTRPVAFLLSGNMAVAYFMAHAPKGFFPMLNGGDGAILYCFIFLLFFVAGPGRWSLDTQVKPVCDRDRDVAEHHAHRTARTAGGR